MQIFITTIYSSAVQKNFPLAIGLFYTYAVQHRSHFIALHVAQVRPEIICQDWICREVLQEWGKRKVIGANRASYGGTSEALNSLLLPNASGIPQFPPILKARSSTIASLLATLHRVN